MPRVKVQKVNILHVVEIADFSGQAKDNVYGHTYKAQKESGKIACFLISSLSDNKIYLLSCSHWQTL